VQVDRRARGGRGDEAGHGGLAGARRPTQQHEIASAQATPGTDHSWPTQHQAWNNGTMDAWIAAKGPFTMGYFAQQDIPFHWAKR
jgi:phospholipase C